MTRINGRILAWSSLLCIWLAISPLMINTFVQASSKSQPTATSKSPIKHVVVLMMENRSFDHFLGWLHSLAPSIDGLQGQEFNLVNSSDSSSRKVYVNKHGFDLSPSDPNHDFFSTTEQIFGVGWDKVRNKSMHYAPKMDGFVQNSFNSGINITNPMSMFTIAPDSAPVINTLALEYAVFDRWYCSLPGPTDPNRAFAMSGTSRGETFNFNNTLWTQQSYFDFLRQHGISWRGYYQEDPWAIMYFNDTNQPINSQYIHELETFFDDLNHGQLAQFTWLQPRMSSDKGAPTWQHPSASVREGERLIKQIYEALRASKYWHELAFVLTYDEHGGFYDHVSPPMHGVPSPDDYVSPEGFTFDRLGIRVPTLVISPYVLKGEVVHEPVNGPTPTSQYDATSIMATCNKLFGISDHLTAREAWAGTFEGVFKTGAPRLDCPMKLPELPSYTEEEWHAQRAQPVVDHMQIQIDFYCKHNNHKNRETCGAWIQNQGDASKFIAEEAAAYMNSLRAQERALGLHL